MSRRYYAVIDTNVVVSSVLKPKSLPGQIIDLCIDQTIIPILSQEILDEYIDVLSRNKFGLSEADVLSELDKIKRSALFLDRTKTIEEFVDEDDVVFYEIALTARDKYVDGYLVTGNKKHFPIKSFVVTPREMIEIIDNDNEN